MDTTMSSEIYKLLDALRSEAKHYESAPDEFDAAIEIAGSVILKILQAVPTASQAVFVDKIAKRFSFLKNTLYYETNRQHRRDKRFEEAWARELDKIRNGRSVHLELGTDSAWPAERVEQEIGYGLGDLIRLDLSPDFGPDVIANAAALPFADESIDSVASNSLLAHVAYPHDVIRECWRVLRPGGVFRVIVPFHLPESGRTNDYLRYTAQFFETVLNDAAFDGVICDAFSPSGAYYTLHEMAKPTIPQRPQEVGSAAVISHIALLTVLGALQIFDDYNLNLGVNFHHATLALAIKPGEYQPPDMAPDRTKPFVDRYLDRLICPNTGLPLFQRGNELVSLDRSQTYPMVNGLPQLFTEFGFGSLYHVKPSSRERLAKWQRAPAQTERRWDGYATHTTTANYRSNSFRRRTEPRYWWFWHQTGAHAPPIFALLSDEEWDIMAQWYVATDSRPAGDASIPCISFISGMLESNLIPNIVQLGHYEGFSTLLLGFTMRRMGFKHSIFSVDIDKPVSDFTAEWVERAGLSEYVRIVVDTSEDPHLPSMAREYFNSEIATVFIDSSHEYEHTVRELNLWFEHLRPFGLTFLHDVSVLAAGSDSAGAGGVRRAATEWAQRNGVAHMLLNQDVAPGHLPLVYMDGCGLGIIQKPGRAASG